MTQGPQGKRATIYDVARPAGVSHQTVSRLIKGSSNISPDLRVRIESAIIELSYRPNVTARNLATLRPDLIAVLTAGTSEYGPSHLLGITEARVAEVREPRPRGPRVPIRYGSGMRNAPTATTAPISTE